MKLLAILLPLGAASLPCVAQQLPPASQQVEAAPVPHPLPDSVRQAIHQLYKRGRLYSVVGGLSGALVASSGVIYLAKGNAAWLPASDILIGGVAAWGGLEGRARFSRRQERKALSAVEQGYPLPRYVAELVPFLPKRNRQLVSSCL